MRLPSIGSGHRGIALLLVIVVVLAVLPGVAAAATRGGGTVVVAEGETVDGLTAFGGTVIVRGTVTDDLTVFGGSVVVSGNVTGSVEAFAGNVRIAGNVGGDVTATGGSVFVERTAEIGGDLAAAGGQIVVAGTVGGDAKLAGDSITLESTAIVKGDIAYAVGEDDEFSDEGATVAGSITEQDDISIGGPIRIPGSVKWFLGVYGTLVNLALGALLLLVFPGTSRRIADRVTDEPFRSGGIGLLALIGIPIGLVLVAITIIGIPITLAGIFLYVLAVWIATIYGRYAIGVTLVAFVEFDNRWLALLVGVIVVGVLVRLPWVGGVIDLLVLLLGLGAMAAVGYDWFRRTRSSGTTPAGTTSVDEPDPAPK